jgi:hypothetical protein
MPVVYKPTSEYSPKFDTQLTKPSLFSGLILNGIFINKYLQILGASTQTIYTVPGGNTFFLHSVYTSLYTSTVPIGNYVTLHVRILVEESLYINRCYIDDTHPSDHSFSNYPNYLILRGGTRITLQNAGAGGASNIGEATITGYLIPDALLPKFA